MIRPPFIETASGRRFQPLDPDPADVDLGDIAHALAHQCRYSGHTRVHYSVAEHCVRVSRQLRNAGANRYTQLWGLLHDASEAYLVDIPSPVKCTPTFAAYREAEKRLMDVICKRFGLDTEEPFAIRVADLILLATEARDLMPFRPEHWGDQLTETPLEEVIVPWGSERAKREFLETFERLTERQ